MNRSVMKLKMRQKKRSRLQRRKLHAVIRLFITAVLSIVVVFAVMFAMKSGTELSRSIKYPVQYSDYIIKYSSENELDPYLVIALIKQESNFVADAKSPYAGGLMQLTELTAEEYGEKLGLTDYDYMDPETNIKIGCFLLRSLIDRYDSVDTALAAYNAGTGNVNKWLNDPQYSTDGKTLTVIPFSETRHYVDKVKSYIEEYKKEIEIES